MELHKLVLLEQKLAGPFGGLREAPPYEDAEVRLTRGELSVIIRALHLLRAVNVAISK